MVDSKRKRHKGSGKVPFLAHLDGIKEMIEAGHPVIAVFEEYEKKMSVKEQQFRKYVREYIRSKPDENQGKKPTVPTNKPIRTRTPDEPAFVSSPTPRDDLIHPKPKG